MGKKNSSTVDEREPMLRGDGRPVGAVLRIGRKNARTGHPELNDRFFIVSRHESATDFGGRKGTVRLPLDEFKSFNERSESEAIRVIRGELVTADRAESWEFRRRAQQLPGKQWPNHPNRRAACECTDNVTATRLYGIGEDGTEDWREIDCPGRACEFSQEITIKSESGKETTLRPCSIFGRFYFVPRWSKDTLPAPLMMWGTRSWHSAENVQSYFNFVEARARELGLERFSFIGQPFILTLTMKTQPKTGRRFPVVDLTPDGDLVDTFANARASIELAGGRVPLMIATTLEEQDPDIVTADVLDISEPAVPGSTNGRLPLFEGD